MFLRAVELLHILQQLRVEYVSAIRLFILPDATEDLKDTLDLRYGDLLDVSGRGNVFTMASGH